MDPGTTTGVAIIDSDGNVLDVFSKRDATKAEIIRRVLNFGRPVIISSDVSTAPRSVEKVAAKLGCIVYSPDISLTVVEKKDMTRSYRANVKNNHENDALSAALKAWKRYRVLFSDVNDVLKKFEKEDMLADVMLKILKEESPNIEDTVKEFVEKEKSDNAAEALNNETAHQDAVRMLQKKIAEKQMEIDSLRNQNVLLSKALNDLKKETRYRPAAVKSTTSGNENELRNAIKHLKKLRVLENKNYHPLIEFERIEGNAVEDADERLGLEGRVVLSRSVENLNFLNGKNIKCLLVVGEAHFGVENLEFPVIKADLEAIETIDGIKAVKADYIEDRLIDARKSGLIGWLKDYKKRKG